MSPFPRLVLPVIFLLVFGTKLGQTVRVEFYKDKNYSGFIEDAVVSGEQEKKCIDLRYGGDIQSVKSDKCLIMYQQTECRSFETPIGLPLDYNQIISFRVDGNAPSVPIQTVRSFHVCDQTLGGGPKLDLTVFNIFLFADPVLEGIPIMSGKEEYRGVCGCRNLPSWVSDKTSSPDGKPMPTLNNHGNSVNLYEHEHCEGLSKYVAAGQGPDSWTVNKLSFGVRSFMPAELKYCYKLEARIHKFQFSNGTNSEDELEVEKVQLATSADINNNGASEITQTYRLSSRFSNTIEFSVADSLTQVHSAGVEEGVEVKAEAGVPLISKVEVTASIKANYQYTRTEGNDKKNTTTTSTEEAIEIEQQIKIPACRVCTVTTFVKKVKGFVIKYKAYANVKAPAGEEQVPAEELRRILPAGLEYVKTVDQHTVEVVTDGTMDADFGIKSMIDVNCVAIAECVSTYSNPADDHQVYESPLHYLSLNKYRSAYKPGQTTNRSTIFPFIKRTLGLLMKHLS